MKYGDDYNKDDYYHRNKTYDMIANHPHLFESHAHNEQSSSNKSIKPRHHHSLTNKSDFDESIKSEELTIVGYSCKLYRDDFGALKQDSQLIPWNGNQDLLIDRYDCRGYLYDLTDYDADLINKNQKPARFTNEEIEIEKACDEERYMFLNKQTDGDEENGDSNDSNKRYGAVKLEYENSNNTIGNENGSSGGDAETEKNDSNQLVDRAFVPNDKLQLPIGMLTPETVKMNQIIVKTASFVVKQGLQMEILLKTKQSFNSQFDFLSYDNYLNPYYKHLQNLIKTNQIDPLEYLNEPSTNEAQENGQKEKCDQETDNEDDDDDGGYLHPLLSKALCATPKIQNKPETDDKKSDKVETSEKKETVTVDEKIEESPKMELEEKIEQPTGEIKIMIDKMAEFVVRNGIEFELNIKKKQDERFNFINDDHVYNKYYRNRIFEIERKKKEESENKTEKSDDEEENDERRSSKRRERDSSVGRHRRHDDRSDSEDRGSRSSSEERKPKKHHKKSHKHHHEHRDSKKKHKKRSRSRDRDKHK